MPSSALEGRAAQPRWPLVVYWMPTIVWLCVLAWFSTDTFSAEHTGHVLARVIHFLFGDVSKLSFQHIHFLVRKSAHFCSYGLLSVLAFFTWRATLPSARLWAFRWCLLALLLTLLAGGSDEFHQGFLASRTSSLRDVAIDMAGALFFQLIIAATLSRGTLRTDGP